MCLCLSYKIISDCFVMRLYFSLLYQDSRQDGFFKLLVRILIVGYNQPAFIAICSKILNGPIPPKRILLTNMHINTNTHTYIVGC